MLLLVWVVADHMLVRPARALFRKRRPIGWTVFGLASALVTFVMVMHAFVLDPARELRSHNRTSFNVSAGLFDVLRGRDVVRAGMAGVLDAEPHRRSVANIAAWSDAHDERELHREAVAQLRQPEQ